MNIFKIILLLFGLFVLFVVTTVTVFVVTFDANEYKQDLSDLVKSKTGRELVFSGDIGLTLYPALGMKLGSMTFSNAPDFGDQPMLSVTEASASVDLLSLMRFEPEIAQLVLDGLQVSLQKNAEGKTNWDDLVKVKVEEEAAESPAPADTPATGAEVKLALTFGGLNITRANLTWQDDQAGQVYQLKNLSLQTGRIEPDQPFSLQLSTRVQSQDQIDADITLNTEVLLKKQVLRLNGLKLQTGAKGSLLPFNLVNLSSSGDVEFSMKTRQLAVRGFDTRVSAAGGALQQASLVLNGEIGFDLDQQHLTIGALDVQGEISDATVPNGKISSGISATKLDLQLTKRSVNLEDLNLTLNDNRFKGFVKVRDFARPAVAFELSSERFDVDKLMGAPAAAAPEQPAEPSPEDIQISLPMQLLRDLQLDGQLKVGTLIAQGLTVNDVLVKLHADKGVIDIKPIQLKLYDGSLAGQLQVDARGDKPVYSISQNLAGFQIGRFLLDFMGDDKVSGQADLDISLKTGGEWLSELKAAVDGSIAVSLTDGALKGFNLREEIDRARAKLKGEKVAERAVRKTDFSALSLSALVNKGVLSTSDLNLQAPLLRVGGKGTANLVEESVDYQVDAKLVGTTKGQQGGEADELSGLLIPVAITGPWISPDINVLLDDILKAKFNAEKAQIREQVEKEKAALQQKLAAEKARLKAAQEKEAAAKKAQLEQQRKLVEAEQKAKLEAEKQRQQAELEAKKKAEEEKARQKLEDKLKKLF